MNEDLRYPSSCDDAPIGYKKISKGYVHLGMKVWCDSDPCWKNVDATICGRPVKDFIGVCEPNNGEVLLQGKLFLYSGEEGCSFRIEMLNGQYVVKLISPFRQKEIIYTEVRETAEGVINLLISGQNW